MISALCWVPRGAAKPVPVAKEPSPEEVAELKRLAEADAATGSASCHPDGLEDEEDDNSDEQMDEQQAVAKAKAVALALKSESRSSGGAVHSTGNDLDAAMAELDMEHYDDSDDDATVGRIFGRGNPGMAYYRSNEEDPYVTLASAHDDSGEEEDFVLKPTDFLILTARNEEEVSNLEVWVYEEADAQGEDNLYVHHDVLLPAFPLSLAWLDCDPLGRREAANLAAVGTMSPGIELWDLDVLDAVEPVAVLGGEAKGQPADADGDVPEGSAKKSKKKKKRRQALKEGSHEDAVLGLAWNREFRNVLASASADKTVKVWDVAAQTCSHTLTHHASKVQAVAWNPAEAPVLLTGAFDKNVCMADMRAPAASPLTWHVIADVEALTWAPHAPTCFLASSEDGLVACFDARKGGGSDPLFRLAAHDKPTCALSFCPAVPGLLATGSTDKQLKLWDVAGEQPTLVATEEPKVGAIFTASFCPEAPCFVAAGGAKGTVAVWDILTSAAVAAKYGRALRQTHGPAPVPEQVEE